MEELTKELKDKAIFKFQDLLVELRPEMKTMYEDAIRKLLAVNCTHCKFIEYTSALQEYVYDQKWTDEEIEILTKNKVPNTFMANKNFVINSNRTNLNDVRYQAINKLKEDIPLENYRDCVECAKKHISQVIVECAEILNGYMDTDHEMFVEGNLACAENHLITSHTKLANEIRIIRLNILKTDTIKAENIKILSNIYKKIKNLVEIQK